MTEDAEGGCSILNPQLADAARLSPDASNSISQLERTLYLNPSMTVDGSCLYTTTDLAGSFPEGTVLQILSDSTILAVPPLKETSNTSLNNSSIIFKDQSFINELAGTQNASSVSNLLIESGNHNGSLVPEVPICSEGNISDIDLSFLNETDDSIAVSTSNDAAVKELQGTIASQSMNVLENNVKESTGLPSPQPDPPKESGGTAEDVVMIDVSKPIQLSQNSLIMVNGQKCVLQHDLETGQVIAYPVKEQEKPRRRRGRPRKSSIGQVANDEDLLLEPSLPEPENASDDDKEHGLLEIVNDDGSLVRRSTRRRKKAKVLTDYETGNLKQELGSDVEDVDVLDVELELSRKRKPRGPGRPRKNPPPEPTANSGVKRNRGRPRKQVFESEPTQAFLVQTADGQTLMMQVPLSSIPAGVSLQEVAQSIANRLNVGLSQANTIPAEGDSILQPAQNITIEQNLESASEPAVQDHSIGSTTNFSTVEQFESIDNTSSNAGSLCQNISADINDVVIDSISDSEVIEVSLKNDTKASNNQPENFLPENMLDNQTQFSNMEMPRTPEESFTLTIPTSNSSSINISSSLTSLPESLSDQICRNKTDDQDLEVNFNQFHIPKDFLLTGDFMKGKMNLQELLENVVNTTSASQLTETATDKVDSSVDKGNNPSVSQEEFTVNANNNLKDFEAEFASQIIDSQKAEEEQYLSDQVSNLDKGEKIDKSYDFLNCDLSNSILDSNPDKNALQNAIISSIEHDHNLLIQNKSIPESNAVSSKIFKSKVVKSEINTNRSTFQHILPLEKATSVLEVTSDKRTILSIPAATEVSVLPGQQQQLSEKPLPLILPSQELRGSKKCKICQRLYFTDEEIIKHFKTDHPKCICNQCNYMADHAYVIKRHSIRHVENGIVCDICGKHYKDHYILKMHIKMVHLPAEVLFTCEVCKKKFTRKAHLKRHLRIHAPNKPYKCSFCNYRGCEKSDITKHLLIHEAPKHTCHVCGKAFRHIKNKELHLKRHFKQRDYKCGICDFYGYTFTDIRKHIERRHSDVNTSTCLDCGLVFKDKELLEEHKSNGQCKTDLTEERLIIKEEPIKLEEGNDSSVLDDMSLDILGETEPTQEPNSAVDDISNDKIPALHPNQLIMSSADGILSTQNGQILVNGLEGTDLLSSENLSFISVGNESINKVITLVSTDGKNFSLSEPMECVPTSTKNNTVETLFLSALQTEDNT